MKIKKEDYEYIKKHMSDCIKALRPVDVAQYAKQLRKDKRVQDIKARIAWDLFNCAVPIIFVTNHLYTYVDDSHIHTAIIKICKEIKWEPLS